MDLTVNSEPIELIMNEGDEIKLNLSSPDFYNLYIRVDALSGERVNVFIQNIFEEMRAEEEPEEEEVVADSIYKNFKAYLYFVTAIVVLIIIFIINRKINKLEKETINNKEVTINELKSKPAVKKKTKKIKRAKAKNKNEKKTKPKTKRKR